MKLWRFKQLRSALTINDVTNKDDPLYKLRPAINVLRTTFAQYVVAGREISLDEACIPCRSSFARHFTLYNPRKPMGKFHFRLYTAACARSWYVHNFKIHSSASNTVEYGTAADNANDQLENASKGDDDTDLDCGVVVDLVVQLVKHWKGILLFVVFVEAILINM